MWNIFFSKMVFILDCKCEIKSSKNNHLENLVEGMEWVESESQE